MPPAAQRKRASTVSARDGIVFSRERLAGGTADVEIAGTVATIRPSATVKVATTSSAVGGTGVRRSMSVGIRDISPSVRVLRQQIAALTPEEASSPILPSPQVTQTPLAACTSFVMPLTTSASNAAVDPLVFEHGGATGKSCSGNVIVTEDPEMAAIRARRGRVPTMMMPDASQTCSMSVGELWAYIVSAFGTVARVLDAVGLGDGAFLHEEQITELCHRCIPPEDGRTTEAVRLLMDLLKAPSSISSHRTRETFDSLAGHPFGTPLTRSALLMALARCPPRQDFVDFANRILLTNNLVSTFAVTLAAGGRPHRQLEALQKRSWERTGHMPISRQSFVEALALMEVHVDDSTSWYETFQSEACGEGDQKEAETLDFGVLARHIVAQPFADRQGEQHLTPTDVAVRLIYAWGDLTSAFSLRPKVDQAADPRPRGAATFPRVNSTALGTIFATQAARSPSPPSRRQVISLDRWERALRGQQRVRLLPEALVRAEAAHHFARARDCTESSSGASNIARIFPNLVERLCVPRCDFLANELIVVRYSLADFGFFGPCISNGSASRFGDRAASAASVHLSVSPSVRRQPSVLTVGGKPFVGLTLLSTDASNTGTDAADESDTRVASTMEPCLRAPVDPRSKCGTVVLRAPCIPQKSDSDGLQVGVLQLFASEDGVTSSAPVGTALRINIFRCVPCTPGVPVFLSTGYSVMGNTLFVDWDVRSPFFASNESPILGHEVGVWHSGDHDMIMKPYQVRGGHGTWPPFRIDCLDPSTEYVLRVRCWTPRGLSKWGELSLPMRTSIAEPSLVARPEVCDVQTNAVTVRWPTVQDSVTMYEVLVRPCGSLGSPRSRERFVADIGDDCADGRSAEKPWFVGVAPPPPPSEELRASGGTHWTEATIAGLDIDMTYYFSMRCIRGRFIGPLSRASDIVRIQKGVPSAPGQTVKVDDAGTCPAEGHFGMSLRWTPPAYNGGSQVVRYFIRGTSLPTDGKTKVDVVESCTRSSSPRLKLKKLRGNTRYTFHVYALNRFGLSPSSFESEPLVTNSAVPTPPTSPAISSVEQNELCVSWNAPLDDGGSRVEQYKVVVHKLEMPLDESISLTAMETSVKVRGLYAGTSYRIQISAVSLAGESAPAEIQVHTLPKPPKAPGVPRLVRNVGGLGTLLTWSRPPGIPSTEVIRYTIYCHACDQDAVSELQCCQQLETETERGEVLGLDPQQRYRFRAQAIISGVHGDLSDWSAVTRVVVPPPPAPSPPWVELVTPSSLKVSWNTLGAAGRESDLATLYEVVACRDDAVRDGNPAGTKAFEPDLTPVPRRTKAQLLSSSPMSVRLRRMTSSSPSRSGASSSPPRSSSRDHSIRATAPPVTLRRLQAGASYVLRLRQRNASNWSEWSAATAPVEIAGDWTKDDVVDSLLLKFGTSMADIFRVFDQDDDGFISFDDTLKGFDMAGLGFIPEEHVRSMFDDLDDAKRGFASLHQFVNCIQPAPMQMQLLCSESESSFAQRSRDGHTLQQVGVDLGCQENEAAKVEPEREVISVEPARAALSPVATAKAAAAAANVAEGAAIAAAVAAAEAREVAGIACGSDVGRDSDRAGDGSHTFSSAAGELAISAMSGHNTKMFLPVVASLPRATSRVHAPAVA
eukprot:TRINITY_DN36931_c0_g1_i1.p1 TRINITY_DN36931_c0_g1~~TRINITY_DN36931_c0_g1_i1.p1  ORF type:complete len:1629 (+),score=231.32 TRINITY_DN36931_c0_g1_i1:113-4999(+)